MAKFRKKPVQIEAFKLTHTMQIGVTPEWFSRAINKGLIEFTERGNAKIVTLEGVMTACVGDYIIQGVEGELYPCKPHIFEMTYEKVE